MHAITVKERFWSKVDRSGGPDACWPWTASLDGRGYGQFGIGHDRMFRAHRMAVEMDGRPVSPGDVVCHHCDNKRCVNPSHLYVGTKRTNTDDAMRRGQTARGERSGPAKLTSAEVSEVKARVAYGWSQSMVAMMFGICQQSVSDIVRGVNWKYHKEA